MFGIGETELLIIVAFGFMIFGPDKLPGMGRTIGRALRQFRQAQEGFNEVVQAEVMDPLQEAMGDPLDTGTRKQHRAEAEQRAAALAQDADIEVAEGAQEAPRKETFAERKARLAAEREAREAAEKAGQAAEDEKPSSDADGSTAPAAPAATASEAQGSEEKRTSAAALYALDGQSSYRTAKEQEAQKQVEEAAGQQGGASPASGEDAGDVRPEPAAEEAAPSDAATDGKEDGSAEA